jgi:hypothetical protein
MLWVFGLGQDLGYNYRVSWEKRKRTIEYLGSPDKFDKGLNANRSIRILNRLKRRQIKNFQALTIKKAREIVFLKTKASSKG